MDNAVRIVDMIDNETDAMLSGQSILCFAPNSWYSIWRNRQQIMSRLARTNRVLYIEPKYCTLSQLRRGQVRWSDVRRPRLMPVMENLWLYRHPVYGLASGRRAVDRLGCWLRIASLRRTMHQLGMEHPILWLCRPTTVDMVGHFNEALVCYHVVDEYTAYSFFEPARRQQMMAAERRLLNLADIVLVVSPTLLATKSRYHSSVHLVRNGVDFDAFARMTRANVPPPSDIAMLPRPRIGYVGAVNDKLDFEMLQYVAKALPTCSLVLVGPIDHCYSDADSFQEAGLENVTFLGRKDVKDVPLYINACDVCLLPYKQNEWTHNIDALKLYEYLACGKPVVSMDLPTARMYSAVIRIADDRETFVAAVKAALAESDTAAIEQRLAVARQNTWDQRVALISELIAQALSSRSDKRSVVARRIGKLEGDLHLPATGNVQGEEENFSSFLTLP
jgi:glycosyltransferase involved in cell wall biosynthesis